MFNSFVYTVAGVVYAVDPPKVDPTKTDSGWDLRTFLENSASTLGDWFNLVVTILGLCAVAFAIWQIVSGLMSQGKKQTNWGLSITLLLVGGALSVARGFDFVKGIAQGGKGTIEDLGGNGGMIILDTFESFGQGTISLLQTFLM